LYQHGSSHGILRVVSQCRLQGDTGVVAVPPFSAAQSNVRSSKSYMTFAPGRIARYTFLGVLHRRLRLFGSTQLQAARDTVGQQELSIFLARGVARRSQRTLKAIQRCRVVALGKLGPTLGTVVLHDVHVHIVVFSRLELFSGIDYLNDEETKISWCTGFHLQEQRRSNAPTSMSFDSDWYSVAQSRHLGRFAIAYDATTQHFKSWICQTCRLWHLQHWRISTGRIRRILILNGTRNSISLPLCETIPSSNQSRA
jgi:hypothetical protein